MKYHEPSKKFVMEVKDVRHLALLLRVALTNIRTLAGLPLDRYTRPDGALTQACFAQLYVIEAAEVAGIDLGVPHMKFNELDLRDAS